MSRFRAGCLQLNPTDDIERNLAAIERLVAEATAQGAELVCLPEYASFLVRSARIMKSSAYPEAEHPVLQQLSAAARRHSIWIMAGSILVLDGIEDRPVNRSYLIGPNGQSVAYYDKIHMFDVVLPDGRELRESAHYCPGTSARVVETPLGIFGLSICYDLRFPHLYRALAKAGAEALFVPAAFTAQTGPAHWEVLLRARAIESGAFVLAPATTGEHPGDWQTYGHAMIIDPWGRVLGSAGSEANTVVLADIDLAEVAKARSRIPSLTSNPDFQLDIVKSKLKKETAA
jgi:predicted amidohydrolase